MTCKFCGKPVDSRELCREMVAWERPRIGKQKGAGSSLVMRNPTGQIACWSCINGLLHGIKVGQQESLFNDVE